MKNENSLKSRIQDDKTFFKNLLTSTPRSRVLAKARKKYPEAKTYNPLAGRLYFSDGSDGWFRWVETDGNDIAFKVMYVPGKEDEE